MITELGRIHELYRYPVKSMAGTSVGSVMLGWHGLDGDRRLAFRRLSDNSGFPWLTASRFPAMLLYQPEVVDSRAGAVLPSHVRTPEGVRLELNGDALRDELSRRFGSSVELMSLNQGAFDEAPVSIISVATMVAVERELARPLDRRRFRPNVVLETHESEPFGEDRWVGRRLVFGASDDGASVSITLRDQRCMMINLDPDTAKQDPDVMKAVMRMNQNNAGVYGTAVREGTLSVGQRVFLVTETPR